MGVKENVIKLIQALPETVSIEKIMEELYFKLQVDAGLKELDNGNGITHEDVEERMGKWLTTNNLSNQRKLDRNRNNFSFSKAVR